MSSPWGRPRAGAFALAGAAALYLALDVAGDVLLKSPDGYKRYETISWLYYACAALELFAIAMLAGAPRAARASRLAWTAFGAYAAREVVYVARQLLAVQLLTKYGYENRRIFLVFSLPSSALSIAGIVLVYAALARIARASAVRVPGVAFAIVPTIATANSLVGIAGMVGSPSLSDSLGAARTIAAYAFLGLDLAVCAWLGVALRNAKAPDGEPAKVDAAEGAISPEWRSVSDALGLYLGAAVARIAVAALSFATMASASGSSSLSDLRSVRDTVVLMAVVGGFASLFIIGALFKLGRAPDDRVRGPANAAALFAIMGLLLDGVTTSITASALGGDLSAAFFAMDALPWLVVGAVILGIAAGTALATALAAAASHLGNPDAERQAKSVRVLIVPAGILLALSQSMGRHPPEGLVVFMVVMGLPLALAAVVRLLQAIFGVRATVAARLRN